MKLLNILYLFTLKQLLSESGNTDKETLKKVNDKLKDTKIKNPETDRMIKVSTALTKGHPAYNVAMNLFNKTLKDIKNETGESNTEDVEQLKKDWKTANDNMEFEKASSILKKIHSINTQQKEESKSDKKESNYKPKEFKDSLEMKTYIDSKYNEIPDPLLKEHEVKAAGFYRTDHGYTSMNKFLRNKAKVTSEVVNAIKTLNVAIKKSKLKDDVSVYRGLELNDTLRKQLSKLNPGDTFSDNGFSSTSLDEGIVKKIFGGKDSGTVLFQINAKKGQSALPMENISTGDEDDDSMYEGEVEMLLPAKSKFKLIGIEGNKYIFEIEE